MANKEILAVVSKYDTKVEIPRDFYDMYSTNMPKEITMEDKFGNKFDGEIVENEWNGSVYIETDTRKIVLTYSYRRFAIVKMTYISKGRFNVFVPDSTRYWETHDYPELLPYEGRIIHPSEYDAVGMYKAARRGEQKKIKYRRRSYEDVYGTEEDSDRTEYTSSESSTMVNIFTGRRWGYMTPDNSD